MATLNPRKLIILGAGSLCSALIVIMLLNAALRPKEAPKGPSGVEVLVAAQTMEPGATLGSKSIRWEAWPDNRIYDGLVTRKAGEESETTGKLKRAVSKGEPITQSAMVSDADATLIAAQLDKGMRAVAIKTSAESSVGGFVTPGDHVDIILSHRVRVQNDGPEAAMAAGLVERDASETILTNVKVLAVDQDANKKDSATVGRTVTMAVTPKQAEMLALVTKMGDLSLSLRGLADADAKTEMASPENDMTTDVEVSRVLGRLHSQNDSGGKPRNVRIYNSSGVDTRLYAAGGMQVSTAQ